MFVMFWEVQRLTRALHIAEKLQTNKHQELMDCSEYISMLGATSVMNICNISSLPSKLKARAMTFARYSDMASSMSASRSIQEAAANGAIPNNVNQMTRMQMIRQAFINFKEQALKALKEQEKQLFSKREQEIKMELTDLSTSVKQKEAMLQSCKERLSQQSQEAGRIEF